MGRRTSPTNIRRKAPKAVPDASRSKARRGKEWGHERTDSQKLQNSFVRLSGCTCRPLHGRIRFELGCRVLTAFVQNLHGFSVTLAGSVALWCRPPSLSVRGISVRSSALSLCHFACFERWHAAGLCLSPKPTDGEFEDLQSELQAAEASVDSDQALYCLRPWGSRSISCHSDFATLQGLWLAQGVVAVIKCARHSGRGQEIAEPARSVQAEECLLKDPPTHPCHNDNHHRHHHHSSSPSPSPSSLPSPPSSSSSSSSSW